MLSDGKKPIPRSRGGQRGVGLLEVLVSLLLTSFGLLALAGLQAKMSQAQFESYQRAQAITLLADMTQRMQANSANDASYVTTSPLGTDDTIDCSTQTTRAKMDQCDWSNALKGTAEKKSSISVGAMTGARGCIELIQASDTATCQPAIYRSTVVWQGLISTVAPGVSCGQNLYGSEAQRRAISSQVVTPLSSC